jgi:hypothetical protein
VPQLSRGRALCQWQVHHLQKFFSFFCQRVASHHA